MMPTAEAFVAIAFLCFLGLLAYLGVHRKLIASLDQRQARIKGDLDEAKRLREEAQALLADFERKGRAAESEAEAIIASAKVEAERLAGEAKSRMEDFVARRTKWPKERLPRLRRRLSPMCAPPQQTLPSPQRRKFSPPPPKGRWRRICLRRASRT
jgi:F0F1-type ATP synthase membrane subunit b/b'